MNLDRVTITGADDSVRPEDLIELSRKYPFVEHGILVSKSNFGSPRFPSLNWIGALQRAHQVPVQFSLHVCGHWVRQLLLGINEIPLWSTWKFQRIQLNFHAENTPCKPLEFAIALRKLLDGNQAIFQIDGEDGNKHLQSVYEADPQDGRGLDAVGLFDVSGGAGILPAEWPEPYFMLDDETYEYCGYAGGLGPDNLEEQLPLIAKAAKGARFWIDMETKVRSADDKQFDLTKVERCLEICKPHIKETK